MRIAVIGDGAMGTLFGALLSQYEEVSIISLSQDISAQRTRKGIAVDGKLLHPVFTADPHSVMVPDLLLLFVKSSDTESALENASCLIGEHTLLMTLQNGAGHEAIMRRYAPMERIVIGKTEQNASLVDPFTVHHGNPGGATVLSMNGSDLGPVLGKAGFPASVSDDINRKRSLILSIAQKAPPILRRLAPKLRKSLLNTRKLLPVERVNELDGKCLEYLLRLEGDDLREKAQKNKMRILGLTKEETYNLLENRVLKDFLERCITKVAKYQREELDYANQHKLFTNQEQDKQLQVFRQRCIDLSQNSVLATVHRQTTLPKPNFVLQKDHDYKQIWSMYLDLIREKRALDQSLVCQQNLFQDVCELLLNTALCHLSTVTESAVFTLKALCSANLMVGLEQRNGHRVKLGCAAGPFMIHDAQGPLFSLEVVSLDSPQSVLTQRKWYQLQGRVFEQLLATAPCCLVLTKVQSFSDRNQAAQQVLIPIFTMHNLTKLSGVNSVEQALYALLERMKTCAATIIPYLLISTLETAQQNTHYTKLGGRGAMCAYLSPISLKPQQWMGSLAHIERTLFSIISEVLDGNR